MQANNNSGTYMNPYLAGVGLGIVLLLTFLLMGRGLGVSGAMAKFVAVSVAAFSTNHAWQNDYFAIFLGGDGLFHSWIFLEVTGVFIGGYFSAKFTGRNYKEIVKGKGVSDHRRKWFALAGGVLMGIGSRLGRGCTSGQALSGGAMLNTGSWIFMICIFIGGYLLARFVKKEWA